MKEDELKLCYIKEFYDIERETNSYIFYFTDRINDVIGDDWDIVPANGNSQPPHNAYVKLKKVLSGKLKELEVLENNEFHSYMDGVDDIMALAWEVQENESSYKRLVFRFGETLQEIEDKLESYEIYFK